jgi:hypothetical protein
MVAVLWGVNAAVVGLLAIDLDGAFAFGIVLKEGQSD